jgi:hypothetical protein
MKEYEIQVTSIITVYVEANNAEDAIKMAYEQALSVEPDSNDAVIVNTIDSFDDVIDDGKNIKMINMTGCCKIDENWTLNDCETTCSKYYSCCAVALANDVLKEYENEAIR